ncbi:hypothetical protein DY000_02004666 [Brassica cretica]|uniref:Thioredoxin domain-containing protein n=1 Tax=Brassica cretica TaxID=69181 RepID=A0ABQ7CCC3_BRACR|nr:hypothetical protein DY000_02004666 [Brassica cretica]
MVSPTKLKSVDFYRKIPRDLTEASFSGAGLSIVAALVMMLLFGMELSSYLEVTTTTAVVVDKSSDGDFLRIDFNISFPALSCEFASLDVSDVLGTNRLNITKTVRKFPIDPHLKATGGEFHSGLASHHINHGEEIKQEFPDGAIQLTNGGFESLSHHFPLLIVNFNAPWCYWSNRLKPFWEKTATIIKQRYDPDTDGRVLLGSVDCTEEPALCRRTVIGYIFSGTIYKAIHLFGFSAKAVNLRNLVISAHSEAHSFDSSQMNMSHVVTHLSFGRMIDPRLLTDMKRLLPYLGQSHDRLDEKAFINQHEFGANVTILITENPKSLSHFITNLCAIIGGVFTVAGIIDSIFHNTIRLIKKVELGKNI